MSPAIVRSGIMQRVPALLASVLALALPVALLPTAPAHATPLVSEPLGEINPHANSELIITKFEQPALPGTPATGLPLDADIIGDLTPIPGVTFAAQRVPGVDLSSPAGIAAAANLTVTEASELVADAPVDASGMTDDNGVVVLGDDDTGALTTGLYLVEEADTPAGVIASAPFLVPLPMENPETHEWMYRVYVYPKNAKVDVAISVNDEHAVTCTDSVTWTTHNSIPQQPQIFHYRTENLFAPGTELASASEIRAHLNGAGAPAIVAGDDYEVTEMSIDGRNGFTVEFTESGRAKLVTAKTADPNADVVVVYGTRVLASGVHTNDVNLYVDEAKPVHAATVTKFGPLRVLVHERGNPSNVIEGAKFKIYMNDADALAGRNPIIVSGIDEWTTDSEGYLTVDCLRFSDFVNGLDRDTSDPLYRYYFAGPTFYPVGWTGEWVPLAGIVNETLVSKAQTLIFRVWQGSPNVPPNGGGDHGGNPIIPGLPVTGGQLAGIGVLGAVLVAFGIVMFLRKRRNDDPAGTSNGAA